MHSTLKDDSWKPSPTNLEGFLDEDTDIFINIMNLFLKTVSLLGQKQHFKSLNNTKNLVTKQDIW